MTTMVYAQYPNPVIGGGGPPTPAFKVLSNGSITPTIGTAGTYTRGGTFLRPDSYQALTSVGANAAPAPAFPTGNTAYVGSTVGGAYLTNALKNWILRASEFDNATWVKNGTETVSANATTDPAGGSTADELIGAASGDGVEQDSGTSTGNETWAFAVWLKTNADNHPVDIILKDQAGSPATTTKTCTLTPHWQQFVVIKNFAAATGNVVVEIKTNDTTGYNVYAYGAVLMEVSSNATTTGLGANYDMVPTIITTNAVAALTGSTLVYSGAELTGVTSNKWTFSHWFYVPTFDAGEVWGTLNFLQMDAAAYAIKARIGYSSNSTIMVAYGNDTYVDTGDSPVFGAWNHIVLVLDGSGDNEVYLNGASIHTSAGTFSAFTPAHLYFQSFFDEAKAECNTLIGWTEVYPDTRMTDAAALALYNTQAPTYQYTEALGSAAIAFKMNQASGNVIDSVSAISLPVGSGSPTYSVAVTGPYFGTTPGITMASGSYFADSTPHSQGAIATNQDFTWDWVCAWSASGTKWRGIVGTGPNSGASGQYRGTLIFLQTHANPANWRVFINAHTDADVTICSTGWVLPFDPGDGVTRAYKLQCHNSLADGTNSLELFVNGKSMGTKDLAGAGQQVWPCNRLELGIDMDLNVDGTLTLDWIALTKAIV